jgi:hypothetical protein
MVRSLDTKLLVATYTHYYPLLEEGTKTSASAAILQ